MKTYSQAANPFARIERDVAEILAEGRTPYQRYLFFRSEAHGVCVVLDGDIQSCAADEAFYHEALVHPAMLLHPNPERVLIMGGGEGATSREVLRHESVRHVVMVDIDEAFVMLCRRHIPDWSAGAFESPRHELVCRDINDYLTTCETTFDVVIGDLVDYADEASPAAALYSTEFYRRLKTRLSANAVVATQAGALVPGQLTTHNRTRTTLAEVFRSVASYGAVVPSFYHLWGFVLAGDALHYVTPDGLSEQLKQAAEARELELPALGVPALAAAFALPQAISTELQRAKGPAR